MADSLDQPPPKADSPPIDTKDAAVVALLGQIVGQTPWSVACPASQSQDSIHRRFGNSAGMTGETPRTILEAVEVPTPFLIPLQPLVEGLTADAVMLAHPAYGGDSPLIHLDLRLWRIA